MTHTSTIGGVALGLVLAMLSGCGPSLKSAYVVDDDANVNGGPYVAEKQEVAVAGSRIKRDTDVEDRATPVKVYSRDEMKKSGAISVGGFLGN